jgi:hypothetical protein
MIFRYASSLAPFDCSDTISPGRCKSAHPEDLRREVSKDQLLLLDLLINNGSIRFLRSLSFENTHHERES